MERQNVTSSHLVSVGYNPASATLEIEFHKRAVYQYFDVPLAVYNGLMTASSHGEYCDANIKKAGYRYSRIS